MLSRRHGGRDRPGVTGLPFGDDPADAAADPAATPVFRPFSLRADEGPANARNKKGNPARLLR